MKRANDITSEIIMKEIAAKLKQRRFELNLTQTDVAERAGLQQSTVARLESEESKSRLDNLIKVIHALDLKIALVKEEGGLY